MKTAIIYDWIDKSGGVERILPHIAQLLPEADIYTGVYDTSRTSWVGSRQVHTTLINRLPGFIKHSRVMTIGLYPYAFEALNFNDYDMVISVTSSCAKGIITRPGTRHICYLLTPTRYLWGQVDDYISPTAQVLMAPAIRALRAWDFIAAQRPDQIIAISSLVAARANKYYRRRAPVIYPGFDTHYWDSIIEHAPPHPTTGKKGYYLYVGRLEHYKRVDLLVEAFNQLDAQLVIVGTGSQLAKLQTQAGPSITFVQDISDSELARYYQNARATTMPQCEEYGYTALESQYLGTPVISYRHSGVAETVAEGKTGIFFDQQSASCVHNAIERYQKVEYNMKSDIRKSGLQQVKLFGIDRFRREFGSIVNAT